MFTAMGSLFAMTPERTVARWAAWAGLAMLATVTSVGSDRAVAEDPPQPVRRYKVRAEIVRMPERPGGYLMVRHEAVDEFVDVTGELVGMDSMVMEFPVAKDASVAGLKAGDKIEALLEVDFSKGFGELEHIRKLPSETVLQFRKARPAANPPARSDIVIPEKQP